MINAQGPRRRLIWAGLLLCWLGVASAAPAQIQRIDPPSWWVGFVAPSVQLMIHGSGVGALTPSLNYPGVQLTQVLRTANPNYLFVTLAIAPDAQPGQLPLEFRRDRKLVQRYAYSLQARRPHSRERKGFDSSDVVYLLMPDRFANGDPANDQPAGTLDHVDRANIDARHGGDLAGIAQHLDYLHDMGYTQLWLTPVVENAQPDYSYHGYSITDHYRVDPRYGRNEDLRSLSLAAHARGIGIIADIVVNHTGSAHWWMRDLPAPEWLSVGDPSVRTNNMHKSVVDPHGAAVDRQLFINGWFDRMMPDLHPMYPPLGNYIVQNAIWWIEYADLAGLRLDTYPYSDKRYMADFGRRVLAEYPDFNIVGEESSTDPALVSYWQAGHTNADGYTPTLPTPMDFPMKDALLAALLEPDTPGKGLERLYDLLADDFLYPHPENLLVFADNHDTDRIYTLLGRDDDLWRMAMALVATTRGIPQITYGTEVLMANDQLGQDGDRRRDFPGGWQGDAVDGFDGRGLGARAASAQQFLRTLLRWRGHSQAVQHGTLLQYGPAGGIYVYFRKHGSQSVMIALNKNQASVTLALERFREGLGSAEAGREVISGAEVRLDGPLALAPRSATVIELH